MRSVHVLGGRRRRPAYRRENGPSLRDDDEQNKDERNPGVWHRAPACRGDARQVSEDDPVEGRGLELCVPWKGRLEVSIPCALSPDRKRRVVMHMET